MPTAAAASFAQPLRLPGDFLWAAAAGCIFIQYAMQEQFRVEMSAVLQPQLALGDPFAALNAEQRGAVEHGIADLACMPPLLVIAGAGCPGERCKQRCSKPPTRRVISSAARREKVSSSTR